MDRDRERQSGQTLDFSVRRHDDPQGAQKGPLEVVERA